MGIGDGKELMRERWEESPGEEEKEPEVINMFAPVLQNRGVFTGSRIFWVTRAQALQCPWGRAQGTQWGRWQRWDVEDRAVTAPLWPVPSS